MNIPLLYPWDRLATGRLPLLSNGLAMVISMSLRFVIWIESYWRRPPYSFGRGLRTVRVSGHWRRLPGQRRLML